jgi:hypothetical protein
VGLRRAVEDPSAETLTPAVLVSLQQTHGNHFVQRLVGRAHPKVTPRASTTPVIQRDASTWSTWAGINGEGGHTFADGAGRFIVIDNALDATEEFLTDLSGRDAGELKKIFRAAKALEIAGHDIDTVPDSAPDKLKTFIKTKQSSGGGRMRFRAAIGPTATGVSKLEKFVAGPLAAAYGGAANLPPFLQVGGMSIGDRARLYDLPNAREDYPLEPLKWAKAQNPTTVGQFVNFTEYYAASKLKVEQDVASTAAT